MVGLVALLVICNLSGSCPSHNDADTLVAATVTGSRSLRSVVREASEEFSRNYADYYAPFLIVRTIKSGDTFREVQCAKGVFASLDFNQKNSGKPYWDDPNGMGRMLICDSFVTEALLPGENEINPVLRIPSHERSSVNGLKVSYSSGFDVSAIDRKRTVEIFSPLNPKRVNDFTYEQPKRAQAGGLRRVEFASKPKALSSKNRMKCTGYLLLDRDNRIVRIVVRNMDDRHTRYIRNFGSMPMATPYTLSIQYARKNGRVFTKSLTQSLSWLIPKDADPGENLYCAENNPCRNPFKNRITTDINVEFGDPVLLKGKAEVKNAEYIFGRAFPAGTILTYQDSCDYGYWERILSKRLDLGKFLHDVGTDWDGLCAQTASRQEREVSSSYAPQVEEGREKLLRKSTRARAVYKKLFGVNYNQDN